LELFLQFIDRYKLNYY